MLCYIILCVGVCMFSCVCFFFNPMDCSPLGISVGFGISMEFPRQEYWSGLPFPPPGHLLNSGIKPISPVSHVLAGGFSTTVLPGRPILYFM